MMKNVLFKKIIIILIVCSFCLCSVGCGNSDNNSNNNSNNQQDQTNNEENVSTSSVFLVNGFENQTELDTLMVKGVLGKVELNTQKEYVKTGSASAKVIVDSNPYKSSMPLLYQSFNIERKDMDLTDFTQAGFVSFSAFNNMDSDVNIGVQLVYNRKATSSRTTYLLPSKTWQTFTYKISREYIPLTTLDDGNSLPIVEGLNFIFDRASEDTVIFIDDIKLFKTTKAYSNDTESKMTLRQNEIASFDSAWQIELMEYNAESDIMASVSQDTTLVSPNGVSGGASLKVNAPAGKGNVAATGRYSGIILSSEQMALVPWNLYSEDYNLKFDLYLDETNDIDSLTLSFVLYYFNDEAGKRMRYYLQETVNMQAGKWTTYSVSLKTINDKSSVAGIGIKDTYQLFLYWGEFTGKPITFHIDEIRLEK